MTFDRCLFQICPSKRPVNIFSQNTNASSGITFPVVGFPFRFDVKWARMLNFPLVGRLPSKAGFHGHRSPYSPVSASETAFRITTSHICRGDNMAADTCEFHAYRAKAPPREGTTVVAVSYVPMRAADKAFLMDSSGGLQSWIKFGIVGLLSH